MKDILEYIGPLWQVAGYPLMALMCVILAATGPTLGKLIVQFWTLRKQRILKHDIFPIYTSLEVRTATRYYVETKCQSVAPSKADEPRDENGTVVKVPILPFFLNTAFNPKKEDYRYYIVLADSGMGKTTFLLNLYLRYINQFRTPQYDIKIFPLAFPEIDQKIAAVEKKRETILLLDAFDEDMLAVQDYKTRLSSLIALTREFREVVITCRTQFFPSEQEEPFETGVRRYAGDGGEQIFSKLYLSPFDDADIRTYLRKRFPWWQQDKRRRALEIVKHSPNLMVRPMLLQHIEDLLQDDKTYSSSYAVYAELINRWVERETRKFPQEQRDRYREQLYQFTREIAVYLNRHHQRYRKGLAISHYEIQNFADRHNIKLSEMEMKSRSLLNRNALGQYKFSHKSILEYFLAEETFFNPEFRQEVPLDGMDLSKQFFEEMIWDKLTLPFFTRMELDGEYRLKDGQSYRLKPPLSRNDLLNIASLKIFDWDADDDALLFAPLKNLKQIYFPKRQLTKEQVTTLEYVLPDCELKIALPQPKPRREKGSRSVSDKNSAASQRKEKSGTVLGYSPGSFLLNQSFDFAAIPLPNKTPDPKPDTKPHYIQKEYEKHGNTIIDHATDLMWQQSGTNSPITFHDALKYIKILNRQKFEGYADWRLPTVSELESLLEEIPQSNALYISPIFDKTQTSCWGRADDKKSLESAPTVNFITGKVIWYNCNYPCYVRTVRSIA